MSRIEAEGLKKISVTNLRKLNMLQSDANLMQTTLTFNNRYGSAGEVGICLQYSDNELSQLTLDYKMVDSGITRTIVVDLETLPCNYGGKRWIFKCPGCYNRCYKLFLVNTYFRCRQCHNLTYESNNRSKKYRTLDKVFGILFEDEQNKAYAKAQRYPMHKGRYTMNYKRTYSRYANVDYAALNAKFEAIVKL